MQTALGLSRSIVLSSRGETNEVGTHTHTHTHREREREREGERERLSLPQDQALPTFSFWFCIPSKYSLMYSRCSLSFQNYKG